MWLTVYRVAKDSAVLTALLKAAEAGKKVNVFMEVQARFDEATNLEWAARMEAGGVNTMYSIPGLKVHAKLAMARRSEGDGHRLYAYLATGNLNEKTAGLYADHGLLTRDERLTRDVRGGIQVSGGRDRGDRAEAPPCGPEYDAVGVL